MESTLGQLSPSQLEFIAENEMIDIVPKFSSGIVRFIFGELGPFRPMIPISVPIWLAITLKKKKMCVIRCPDWLRLENLEATLHKEQSDRWSELPFHYIEIASLLLSAAEDDIVSAGSKGDVQKIRSLLETIQAKRAMKLREGLMKIQESKPAFKLNNLSAMELNTIRPFFVEAMNTFYKLSES